VSPMPIQFTFAHVETFIAVAETGSFRAASERLHISQPAVSARIQQLEARIGLGLLTRTTRSVQPTPEGQRFLEEARHIFAGLEDLAEGLRERMHVKSGVVSIAAMPSIAASILPTLMRGFQARYPRISLRIGDATSGRAADLLANGEVDLAIMTAQPRQGMEFVPLVTDPCLVIACADHPLANLAEVTLRDLTRHPMLLYPRGTTLRETIDAAFETIDARVTPAYEAHNVATLVSLAEAGFGIAFAPRLMLRRISLGSCAILRIEARSLERNIGILRLRGLASPAVQAFIDFSRLFNLENATTIGAPASPIRPIDTADQSIAPSVLFRRSSKP
jgi:LysR family carnitine catabolism transcriptional activator